MSVNMDEMVESGAEAILASKRILLRHPGARKINELYPTPSKCSTQLAEVTNSHGRYRSSANSLQLGGTSTFTISTSSIIQNWELHASIVLAGARSVNQGWLFNAIDQIDVSYSNSLIQGLTLSGPLLREFLLYSCPDAECRRLLLESAGSLKPATGRVFNASIPVGILILSAVGNANQYGLDQSTLSGPIQLTVRFKAAGAFTTNTSNTAAAVPTAFSKLELTCDTSEIQSSMFSVRNALAYNQGSSYNIPVKYLSSTNVSVADFDPATAGAAGERTVNLTAAPAGMLEAILISLKPTSELNSAASGAASNSAYFPIGGSVDLATLRLRYGGQDIFRADTPDEIKANYRSCFGGDVMSYTQQCHTFTPAGPGPMSAAQSKYEGNVIVIPFTHDGKNVSSGHLVENLNSYSGATLELRFSVDPVYQRTEYLAGAPFAPAAQIVVGSGSGIAWDLQVCYVISGILEIGGGVVDLQL